MPPQLDVLKGHVFGLVHDRESNVADGPGQTPAGIRRQGPQGFNKAAFEASRLLSLFPVGRFLGNVLPGAEQIPHLITLLEQKEVAVR